LARTLSTATEPDAVRVFFAGPAFFGAFRLTGLPSNQNPGPSGYVLILPNRSSRSTTPCSQRTTAPTKPELGSSTTIPFSSSTSTVRPFLGFRQSPASTSFPYRSATAQPYVVTGL
jgi:hypothetical protein